MRPTSGGDIPYIVSNVAKNIAAPVYLRVRPRRGSLGIDRAPERGQQATATVLDLMDEAGIRPEGLAVELGPGRSSDIAIALKALGYGRVIGLDTDPRNQPPPVTLERYRSIAATIPEERHAGAVDGDPPRAENLDITFQIYAGTILPFPAESVDFFASKSVLEHVPGDHVPHLLSEMHRCLRPGGWMIHLIDLRDHMKIDGDDAVTGNWLEALRYSPRLFNLMFGNRSTYINRFRAPEWLTLFQAAGFTRHASRCIRFPLPEPSVISGIRPQWRGLSASELSVGHLHMVLHKPLPTVS